MWDAIVQTFTDGSIWGIIVKVLITLILSGLAGVIGTLVGKVVANCRFSKINKYAKALVRAAEQKYPNEGK